MAMSVTDVNDSRPLPVSSLPPADELGGLRTGSHGHGDVRCANGIEQQLGEPVKRRNSDAWTLWRFQTRLRELAFPGPGARSND